MVIAQAQGWRQDPFSIYPLEIARLLSDSPFYLVPHAGASKGAWEELGSLGEPKELAYK